MTREKTPREPESLRDLLRQGDPAADGHYPTHQEIAAWRREMLREAEERRRPALRPAWLVTAAAVVVVAAAVGWIHHREGKSPPPRSPLAGLPPTRVPAPLPGIGSGGALGRPANLRHARTIQFRGPSGTRIIWKLDPDFTLSGT